MPKKSAKKTKTKVEGAEVKEIKTETRLKEINKENNATAPEKPNFKEYINTRYAHTPQTNKWVWIMVISFMIIILALWTWIIKIQITHLNWQATQEELTSKLQDNWDKNYEKIRKDKTVINQLEDAWGNIVASLPTSTVSSTVPSTTILNTNTTTPTTTITNTTTL